MTKYNSTHTGPEIDAAIVKSDAMPAPEQVCHGGWFNYNDLATSTTPISVLGGLVAKLLTNDGLGPLTELSHAPASVSTIYNVATGQFDLSQLRIGDTFSIRSDIVVTTTANNQEVVLEIVFGIGSASEFTITFAREYKKNVGVLPIVRQIDYFILNANIRDYPCEIRIKSQEACTVKVNGWFVPVMLRGK